MWSPMIVLVLPAPQLGGELGDGAEGRTAIELLAIGAIAALDFSVALPAPRRNVAMGSRRRTSSINARWRSGWNFAHRS